MKNKIYYLGIGSAMLTACGCLFKIMHWPLAGILITLALVILSLVFIPLATAGMIKAESDRRLKYFYLLAAFVMVFNFMGALFKIMHWPGAGVIMMIAIPLPFVVLLPVWLLSNRARNKVNYKNLLAVMFFFAYFAAISSILAIRVSYNVVKDFSLSADKIASKTEVVKDAAEPDQKMKAVMNPVNQQAEVLYKKIGEIRQLMLQQDNPVNTPDQKPAVYSDVKPSVDLQYLTTLKAEIVKFKAAVQKQYGSDSQMYKYTEEAFELYSDQSPEASWEVVWLSNNIVASAMESMNLLEFRVRLIELESSFNETRTADQAP